jgi:hypothetical protein
MPGDDVTIDCVLRHAHVIGLFRDIVDTDDLSSVERELMAVAHDPKLAFNAAHITAFLLFLLVDGGFPREELHTMLKRIQDDYEDLFYQFQLRNIEAAEGS